MTKKFFAPLLVAVTTVFAAGCSAGVPATGASHALTGVAAPSLETDAAPGDREVGDDRVAVVTFWSSSCRSCAEALRVAQNLGRTLPADVRVVTVNVDDDRAAMEAYASSRGVTATTVWDRDKTVASRYDLPALPAVYVVDRSGTVRLVQSGYDGASENELVNEVAELARRPQATAVARR